MQAREIRGNGIERVGERRRGMDNGHGAVSEEKWAMRVNLLLSLKCTLSQARYTAR